jgi:8-oxo-dGTP pyrophosphatase MutT (NUDIX family)
MKLKETCLIFVWAHNRESVLIIEKLRGMGKGKWNFPGGKRQGAESDKEMVLRELKEETSLQCLVEIEFCGEIEFLFEGEAQGNWSNRCRLYSMDLETQELPKVASQDLTECRPFWVLYNNIEWDRFWPDDRNWVPQIRQRAKVFRRCLFDSRGELQGVETLRAQ